MSVIQLLEAKKHLKITGATHDLVLPSFITAAESAIAQICGPLEPTPITRRITSRGTDSLALPISPAIELTSVTPLGSTALDLDTLHLDTVAAVVYLASGGSRGFSAAGYDVAYIAGRAACPDDLRMLVLERLRGLWTASQRGTGDRRGSDKPQSTAKAVPTAVPDMAPHVQIGFS